MGLLICLAGLQVMVASSKAAMHASSQDCKPNFAWKDYNRFSTNQCLSFGVRSPGDIDIAVAEMPTRPEGALILHIGVEETMLQTWDKVGKTWAKIWSTKSNLALATGSHALMSKFWLCVTHNITSGQSASLTFGVRDIQIVELQVDAFEPRYFALKCSGFDGSFTSIDVHPYDVYMGFISGKKSVVTEAVCSISHCGTLTRGGSTPGTCRCTACQAGKAVDTVYRLLLCVQYLIDIARGMAIWRLRQVTSSSRVMGHPRMIPVPSKRGRSSTRALVSQIASMRLIFRR